MRRLIAVCTALLILTACGSAPEPDATPAARDATAIPVVGADEPASGEEAAPAGMVGPDDYPADTNPLTGLPVPDPAVLDRRPVLIKVSNESAAVRPQSGLSRADHVWEHAMEDLRGTRFTAVYYSQSAEWVGSVRSARLLDIDHLIGMYGGLFVTSGGSSNLADPPGSPPRIRELLLLGPWSERVLSNQTGVAEPIMVRIPDVPEAGTAYYHSLFAAPDEVWAWAEDNALNQRPDLGGLAFAEAVPAGGSPAPTVTVDYPDYGPAHTWTYQDGLWLSSTDGVPDTDYLNGERIAFANVVIIEVGQYTADFLEDDNARLYAIGQTIEGEGPARVLRDGQVFDVRWQTGGESMIRLVAAGGTPFPLKPGTVWFMTNAANMQAAAITVGAE
ncbi:MAG: DUF3048 domain-containing protein [Chloroflexi bacterium]|nr:DUF3048 domain-containing protein [Chloroflexota bacterium]